MNPRQPPSRDLPSQGEAERQLAEWLAAQPAEHTVDVPPADLLRSLSADVRQRWQRARAGLQILNQLRPRSQADPPFEPLLDLILQEIRLRRSLGKPDDLEAYLPHLPDLVERLRDRLDAPSSAPPGMLFVQDDRSDTATQLPDRDRLATVPEGQAQPQAPGYEILEKVGHGAGAVVYKARQKSLNRIVALKLLAAGMHAGREPLARFRAEAEAVARLQHPNIVQLFEVGEHQGCPYLVLEFVPGRSLAAHLDGTPRPARQAAELVRALARAMHHAHEQGVVHGDLKPTNVLLAACGLAGQPAKPQAAEELVPKITGFGLAASVSPEQARSHGNSPSPATDIYSLGAILYELLTGRPPFPAGEPVLPRDLDMICLQCLQQQPGRRYASAQALADDLERFLDGRPVHARPVSLVGRLFALLRFSGLSRL